MHCNSPALYFKTFEFTIFFPKIQFPGFWVPKTISNGLDPSKWDPPMGPELSAGLSLARMVLMLKVLAFMEANHVMTLIEMMLSSVLSITEETIVALQYFNYMGMLAVEGTYDKMEALLSQNIHPVDILLMLAASEGDKPKIEELMRAGANYTVKDADGWTALDRAAGDEIKDFILGFSTQKA
ncbi:hypothetical protein Pint_04196 [Pistacia integerrima]|uniref:Uncharacterized protein n=1 Tax=Pistacia integerrima TaxID=434235 RepID=A0ACC0Z9Y4_9ROSI|nr:hypothetical protein Pint_04196 [Pistacia integerrima]